MSRKENKTTKSRIVDAAWDLFYEQGYDNTTIDDILERSNTSKGSFYHYFNGKDALLSSLSFWFDEKYEYLKTQLSPDMNAFDQLMFLNKELFLQTENKIPLELLARLYSTQLITLGEKHLLDRSRTYYKLLREIVISGQEKGEIRNDVSVNEVVKAYALYERALLYDWCICNGEYSLYQYSSNLMPMFLSGFRSKSEE